MRDLREWNWARGVAFCSGFTYLLLAIFRPLNPFDEGIVVVAAERILHGAVPYRDFAAYYTPGQFYTLAAVFHIFGSSILTERIWDTVVRFSVCLLVFFLARTLVPDRAAYLPYLPYLIVVLLFGWSGFFSYPVIPAMLCALGAALLLIRGWPENGRRGLFLAGVAAGLSVFFRQDVGVYLLAGCGVAILFGAAGGVWDVADSPGGLTKRLRFLVWFGLGVCVILVPLLLYFLEKIPPRVLYGDFMILPRLQVKFRHLPLPTLLANGPTLLSGMLLEGPWFLFYVPLAIFAASFIKLVRRRSLGAARAGGVRRQFSQLLLTVFGFLLFVTALTRADDIHCLAPVIPAAILSLPLFLEWADQGRWDAASVALCLMVLAIPYVKSPLSIWSTELKTFQPWSGTSSLVRARFFHVPADQEAAVRFIQERVPEGQAVFVGNDQHRRVFVNDILFYFLADRPPGTRYEEFEPGVVTTAPVQKEMVRELQENRVHWVVLCSEFELQELQLPPGQRGSGVLDRYIRSEYGEVAKFGSYSILEKREIRSGTLP